MPRIFTLRSGLAALALPLALSLAGCSRPAVAPKPPAFQADATAVRDWDAVAQRIGAEIAARGLLAEPPPPFQTVVPSRSAGIYVHSMVTGSAFLTEVKAALIRDILARGGLVARAADGSVVVNLDVDMVRFDGSRKGGQGAFSLAGAAAGTGILVSDGVPYSAAGAAALTTGAGVLADLIIGLSPRTDTEAIWRASIVSRDSIVMQLQAPIYVADGDAPLYGGIGRNEPIASMAYAPDLAMRRLRFAP